MRPVFVLIIIIVAEKGGKKWAETANIWRLLSSLRNLPQQRRDTGSPARRSVGDFMAHAVSSDSKMLTGLEEWVAGSS